MKKKKGVLNWVTNLFLVVLLLIGLALVFNNQIKYLLMSWNTSKYDVTAVTASEIKENEKKPATFDFDGVQPLSTQAVLEAQFSNKRLPVIGGIAIPSVGINLPIFKGLANEALLFGAGTFSETQKMGEGNYALASHRTDRADLLFTPLEEFEVGNIIYLTDLEKIYSYKAYDKQRVVPTQTEVLNDVPNKKVVTLVTCGDLSATTRIIVQGELTAITPIKEATDEMMAAFQMEQKTY